MSNKVYKKVNKYNVGSWLQKNAGGVTAALGGATSLVSDIQGALAGNQDAINNAKAGINQVNNTTFNAGNTSSLMSQWGAVNYADPVTAKQLRSDKGALGIFSSAATGLSAGASLGKAGGLIDAGVGGIKGLVEWLGGKSKAKKRARKLNEQIVQANDRLDRNFETAVDNLEEQQLNNALMNYAAYGGPLETNGITWPSELIFINNGGTHEQNPNEGIQVGVDSQGVPNLVEEGEVIYGDYVFSNRLKVPKKDRKEFKLGNKDISFADAIEKLSKESEERPNDPISKLGLEANLNKLIASQEEVRNERKSIDSNLFDKGGNMITINGQKLDKTRLTDDAYLNSLSRETQDYISNNFNIAQNGTITRKLVDKLPTVNFNLSSSLDNAKNSIKNTYNDYNTRKLSSKPKANTKLNNDSDSKFNWQLLLRYAPVVGNAIGLLTNKADYSNIDAMANAINNADINVSPKNLNDYLPYNPFDIDYTANKINAQAAANRRAIINNSSGNRGMANAALLAADFNNQIALGDAYRQAAEYNQGLKERVAAFNRGTNQYNSQMGLQADMFNAESDRALLNARMKELAMREDIRRSTSSDRSANLTSLFDNLGAIGTEAYNREVIRNLPLYYDEKGKYKACGGKIKRRRK